MLFALLSSFSRIGGAGGGDVGDGFFDKLLLDPIIIRRIRAARSDCVSLVSVILSAMDFILLLLFAFFDLSLSLETILSTDPLLVSSSFGMGETVDCGGLSSCCFECTKTPGLSGHFPTAAVGDVVCWVENDSARLPRSSPYPGGGLGVSSFVN